MNLLFPWINASVFSLVIHKISACEHGCSPCISHSMCIFKWVQREERAMNSKSIRKKQLFLKQVLNIPFQQSFTILTLAPSNMWLHRQWIRQFGLPKTQWGESVPCKYSIPSSYPSLVFCPLVAASRVPAILIPAPMATSLCSSSNGSISSSLPSTAMFYNMEVAWFYLTTFFPLFIRPSVFVPKPLLWI